MTNKLTHIFLLILVSISISSQSQDRFADIGTHKYDMRTNLLTIPQPPVLPAISLPLVNNPSASFRQVAPISTKEELYVELAKMKTRVEPFLQNLAPALPSQRLKIMLTEFKWRKETSLDLQNFTSVMNGDGTWELVKIPHYAPPLGRAATYYYKEIELSDEVLAKGNLFLCFKGVDYKASVFVNGSYCGFHEGFFAPFEFDITKVAHRGKNILLVKVENDFSTSGSRDDKNNHVVGDKIYAATGPGYDEPNLGWHHCPAAMGIYQDCYIESRQSLHINDVFVRPLVQQSKAEAWIEVNNLGEYPADIKLKISVYGQNFRDTVCEDIEYVPSTTHIPGIGDLAKSTDWETKRLKMGYGVNYLRIPLEMKNFRYWCTETPWLYQIQIKLYNQEGQLTDTRVRQFGMRSFTQDTVTIPKGKMYLNNELIRLRGANTMGHEQQCVMRKDFDQLLNDLLLAKLANMNYLRFTQRPVQDDVYEICDKIGLLNQADLPLFGSIRRNKFAEAVKQAEEMERLVRAHPSTIMVSYINERFPNADGSPHRSLNTADEYYRLFAALDQAVLLSNPDRVIKAGDGDYDPPSPGLPDSHCYNTWYNGHGLGIGQMYKGFWQPVKPDWLYACGEFGAEGLDPLNVMQKYYPREWLPASKAEEKSWNANRIAMSQTHRFHYMWYNTQHSLQDWINTSQDYQAWAVKFVTETFRRDPRMVSFAVHLFIDAWPAGWMKSIMDVDRQPKKAYFAYRNALEPLMVSIRSDRRHFFTNEQTAFEFWICNDRNSVPDGCVLKYQIEKQGMVIFSNQVDAQIAKNSSSFQGFLNWTTPAIKKRSGYVLRTALVDSKGGNIFQNEFPFEVFPKVKPVDTKIFVLGDAGSICDNLMSDFSIQKVKNMESAQIILINNFAEYQKANESINKLVSAGAKAVFLELPAEKYEIAGTRVEIQKTTMGDYYFVSPGTGHPLVKEFKSFDFNLWYNASQKLITPLLANTISAPDWTPILSSGAFNWIADKGTVMAAAELKYGKGFFRICEVKLQDMVQYNPVAHMFLDNLLGK